MAWLVKINEWFGEELFKCISEILMIISTQEKKSWKLGTLWSLLDMKWILGHQSIRIFLTRAEAKKQFLKWN